MLFWLTPYLTRSTELLGRVTALPTRAKPFPFFFFFFFFFLCWLAKFLLTPSFYRYPLTFVTLGTPPHTASVEIQVELTYLHRPLLPRCVWMGFFHAFFLPSCPRWPGTGSTHGFLQSGKGGGVGMSVVEGFGTAVMTFVVFRARACTHLQCFDASIYLQMNER